MAPKQMYGKRSRAVYDPFQAFVSPQRPAPKSNIRDQGVFVAEVVEELSRLKVDEKTEKDVKKKGRRALGERSVNETVAPVKQGKTKRKDEKPAQEDVADTEQEKPKEEKTKAPSRRKRSLERPIKEKTPEPTSFVPDDVPLFVDGHGYDSEVEEPKKQAVPAAETPKTQTQEPSQAPATPSVSILPPTPPTEVDPLAQHCSPLLSLSSHGITNFTEWTNELTSHFSLQKIAEASFGEVYRLSLLEDLSTFSAADESVLKIIALKAPESSLPPKSRKKERAAALKNAEAMSKVEDVASEVKLLQRMSTIPGYTNFRDIRILRGRPPAAFIAAFRAFNAEQKARKKDLSVFPDPAKKSSYPEDQLWAVIEMQDAGADLEREVERGECSSIWHVWDVFWQVVLTLGKGEEGAGFEHRDLHLGNVCVRRRTPGTEQGEVDITRKLHFTGLETTVIDYTLSRAVLSTTTAPSEDQDIAYHNLSTPSSAAVFEGNSDEGYQYDIYRYMRGCVLASDPYYIPPAPSTTTNATQESPWRNYHPKTNLIWLHYLLHTLLESLHWPSSTKAPSKKRHGGRDFAKWKRANDLEHVLLRVQALLDPAEICAADGVLASAGTLVGWALEEGWLGVGDVVGDEDSSGEGSEVLELDGGKGVVGEGETLGEVGEAEKAGKSARTRKRQG